MFLVSTSSLAGYGLHKAFKLIKESGYHGVDLVIDHDNYDTWDKDYLKSLFIEFNLPIVSITAPSQKLNEEKVNIILEIAQTVEAKSITFAPPHISDKNIKWFKTMLPSLKPEGIDIVVQNVPPKFLFFIIPEYKNSTLDQIKKITGNTALDVLGIDASSGMDINKASEVLGKTLKTVYLSDKSAEKEGLVPGNAGGGVSHLPLESFLMKLKTSGYTGNFCLKVEPLELSVGIDTTVIEKLKKVKEYMKKHFTDFKAD